MKNNRRLILRVALVLLLSLMWLPTSFGRETVEDEPSVSESRVTQAFISRVSAACGVSVENRYLPKTMRGRTMCGAAVSDMVSCMSQKLGLAKKCDARCGNGKDFAKAGCTAKMKKCGYIRAHPGSPECAKPGAVTAFLRSPTPRGRIWGHVQFGCGDRFCSSYKTPIARSWPHGKTPDVCYVPDSEDVGKTPEPVAEVKPTKLPLFDYVNHPIPTGKNCRNCELLASLVHKFETADPDARIDLAVQVADVMRKTSADLDQRSPEGQRLETKAMMISSLAVSNGDFDAATTFQLMGVCAKDPDAFNDVFEDFEPYEQTDIVQKMQIYQHDNKMGLGCKIPTVGDD